MYFKEDQWAYGEDDLARACDNLPLILKTIKCSKHKRRPRIIYHYDDETLTAEISVNCCRDFSQIVAEIILQSKLFHKVTIID